MTKHIVVKDELAAQFKFLSRATMRSKNSSNYELEYIHVSDSDSGLIATATDGHRMHQINNLGELDLKPGFWIACFRGKTAELAFVENNKNDEWKYPDTESLLNKGKAPEFSTTFASGNLKRESTSVQIAALLRSFPEPTMLNLKYLSDLGDYSWDVKWYGSKTQVIFTRDDLTAVIMPINSGYYEK